MPVTDIAVKKMRIRQSKENCFKLNKKPNNELMAIIIKDVPTAVFMGSFKNSTRIGIIRNPPPAPNKPVTIPTISPAITN